MNKQLDWLDVALSVSEALCYTDATGIFGEDEHLLAFRGNAALNLTVHELYRFELAARNNVDAWISMTRLDTDAPEIEWQRESD